MLCVIDELFNDEKTLIFLMTWGRGHNQDLYNEGFLRVNQLNKDDSFVLTLKEIKEIMLAKGIFFQAGDRPDVYAHKDIAIDFYTRVFSVKKYERLLLIICRLMLLEKSKE